MNVLKWSPDGKMLAIGTSFGVLQVIEWATSKSLHQSLESDHHDVVMDESPLVCSIVWDNNNTLVYCNGNNQLFSIKCTSDQDDDDEDDDEYNDEKNSSGAMTMMDVRPTNECNSMVKFLFQLSANASLMKFNQDYTLLALGFVQHDGQMILQIARYNHDSSVHDPSITLLSMVDENDRYSCHRQRFSMFVSSTFHWHPTNPRILMCDSNDDDDDDDITLKILSVGQYSCRTVNRIYHPEASSLLPNLHWFHDDPRMLISFHIIEENKGDAHASASCRRECVIQEESPCCRRPMGTLCVRLWRFSRRLLDDWTWETKIELCYTVLSGSFELPFHSQVNHIAVSPSLKDTGGIQVASVIQQSGCVKIWTVDLQSLKSILNIPPQPGRSS